jgi:antirestriction protein ArdC
MRRRNTSSSLIHSKISAEVSLLHIIHTSRLLEVLRDDDHAIVRAASAASKAADYLLAFRRESDQAVGAVKAFYDPGVSASPEMTGA